METTTPTARTFADHLRTTLLLVVAGLLALTASVVVAASPAHADEPEPDAPFVHRTGRQLYNQCRIQGGVVEADPPGPNRQVHCVVDGTVLFTCVPDPDGAFNPQAGGEWICWTPAPELVVHVAAAGQEPELGAVGAITARVGAPRPGAALG